MIGIVNSNAVDIYVEPRSDSELIGHVANGNLVEIDEAQSVGKYYKICTVIGIEGFCKKKYISIEK